MALSKGFRVYEKNIREPPAYSILLEHRNKSETLLFESHALAVLTQAETDAVKKQYTKIQDGYGCLGVLQINAGNQSILYLVMVTACFSIGKIGEIEIFRVTQTAFIPLQFQQPNEDKTIEIKRLLNTGTFYFSWCNNPNSQSTFDITLCAQRCYKSTPVETDNRFFWNRMLHIHFLRYGVDCSSWLLKVMCGSAEIRTVYARTSQARVAILSRLSCERTGTRFNVRGVNDEGHVANFVETEQCIFLDSEITSYVQTRGSVPLFWEQPGVQVGSHKVKLSRGFECSVAAFNKHIETLKYRYGKQAIINLLGTSLIGSKEGEAMLSVEFQRHQKESAHGDVPHIVFDYHQECRGGNTSALSKLKARIEQVCTNFGFCYVKAGKTQTEQIGTIRTNCLDCLDRTNCVQTFLGLELLKEQVEIMGLGQNLSRFEEAFRQMWVNNGNEISKIYAGTGAIQGSSKIIDGARSAARTIQNNLLDNPKQEAIDILLLGSSLNTELADRSRILLPLNLLHAPVPLLRELCSRFHQYTEKSKLKVAVGTYNVNGGKHFRSVVYKDVSLTDWLLDAHRIASEKALVGDLKPDEDTDFDIFAIGFQEIVDLNASNIMAASSENAKAWAEELQKVLSRDREYCLLTYTQLVGVCLYIFVKPEHARYIKDVAIDSVKTGLGGATGNKGAVAIRFVYNATSMCFVCSHFAAGQSQVAERNADFAEITRKIMFPMGRTLKSHDYIFWCGDFNYRIDMDKEELKECINIGDLAKILENDQLKKQQQAGSVFVDYNEGEIDFDPTYKYDLFSDDYDTSEKQRAPAYTDRVLWKRRKHISDDVDWSPGKIIHYGRAELKQSDHRPVIAIIEIEVLTISPALRQQTINEVIQYIGPPDSTLVIQAEDAAADDEDGVFDEVTVNEIIQELSSVGELTLVRFTEDTMFITFRDGQQTLNALSKERLNISGKTFNLSLKTPNWSKEFEKEIALCSTNTTPMVTPGDYNCLGIPEVKQRPKSPPSRPPLPKSPMGTPKKTPKVGVISLASAVPQPVAPIKKDQSEYEVPQPESVIYEEIKEKDYSIPSGGPPPIPQRKAPQVPAPPEVNKESNNATSNVPVIPPRRDLPQLPPPTKAPPPLPARTKQ